MRKRFVIAGIIAVLCAFASMFAANIYPDQTWNALHGIQEAYDGLRAPSQPPPSQPEKFTPVRVYTDKDGYEVISAWKHNWAKDAAITVRMEVEPDPFLHNSPPDLSYLPSKYQTPAYREAMRDFVSKYQQPWILEEHFVPANEFTLLPKTKLRVENSKYCAFSAVGFNHNRDRAIAYVVFRDGRFGDGGIFLFRKTNSGAWVVESSRNIWIT